MILNVEGVQGQIATPLGGMNRTGLPGLFNGVSALILACLKNLCMLFASNL